MNRQAPPESGGGRQLLPLDEDAPRASGEPRTPLLARAGAGPLGQPGLSQSRLWANAGFASAGSWIWRDDAAQQGSIVNCDRAALRPHESARNEPAYQPRHDLSSRTQVMRHLLLCHPEDSVR